jgi:nucleoid-associated protein YgaU
MDKLKLSLLDAGGLTPELTCQFNPKEITITKSASWSRADAPHPDDGGPAAPEYKNTGPRTIAMELLFDDWETTQTRGPGSVMRDIETLNRWMSPTETSVQQHRPAPPIIALQWGGHRYFECFLKSLTIKFTMFRQDGTPCRATASCTFEETSEHLPLTNPTSGGLSGRRSRQIGAGDTLHSIAYGEYGDPALWRGLAAVNDIDDPLRVGLGSSILVPPREEVEDLS